MECLRLITSAMFDLYHRTTSTSRTHSVLETSMLQVLGSLNCTRPRITQGFGMGSVSRGFTRSAGLLIPSATELIVSLRPPAPLITPLA